MSPAEPPQQIGFTPAESTPQMARRSQAAGRRTQRGGHRARRHRVRPSRESSAPTSPHPIWTGWPAAAPPSTAFTSPRCAPPPAPRSSPDETITRSGWAFSPTSPWPTRATPPACRSRPPPSLACSVTSVTRPWPWASGTSPHAGTARRPGPFDTWPLGVGFERYYGFLQGDTNHWAPNLVCDNHYIEAPRRPEEGYHLSEDLADQAIRMVQDQQQAARRQAVLLVLRPGGHARTPPRGARVG